MKYLLILLLFCSGSVAAQSNHFDPKKETVYKWTGKCDTVHVVMLINNKDVPGWVLYPKLKYVGPADGHAPTMQGRAYLFLYQDKKTHVIGQNPQYSER